MRYIKAVLASRLLGLAGLCALSLSMSGCSGLLSTYAVDSGGSGISGKFMGGQLPVSGAKVYVYAAPKTGYGNASISQLTSAVLTNHSGRSGKDGNNNYYVTTDANGAFSITPGSDWTCTAGTDVYLLGVGGNPGAYSTNASLMMMAALGNCSSLPTFVAMNEVTTVASVYALAGFMSSPTQVSAGTSTAASNGLNAAFATMTNLVNIATGVALATTPNGNGTPPQMNINTLASIIAVCENSSGATGGTTVCDTLFADATPANSNAPTNTIQALINIAHNAGGGNMPGATTLYTDLMPTQPAFTPDLPGAPNDWSMPISFTGGGLSNAYDIAIDGNNNVWVVDDGTGTGCSAVTSSSKSAISKFTNLGVSIASSTLGYTSTNYIGCPDGIAIDTSNNAWVVNDYVNYLTKLVSGTGTAVTVTQTGYAYAATCTSNMCYGNNLAFDNSGNLFISNYTSAKLTKASISGSTVTLTASTSGAGGLTTGGSGNGISWGVAVSTGLSGVTVVNNGVFVASYASTGRIAKFNSSLAAQSTTGYTGAGLFYPYRLAVDQGGNIWAGDFGSSASAGDGYMLSEIDTSGNALSPSAGFTGGGLYAPFGIAVDGNNHIWAANAASYSVSEFDNSGDALSPYYGYTGTTASPTAYPMVYPEAVAIDEAGNVWTANYASGTGSGTATITELVGAATPTLTPIAAATAAGTPAAKP